MSHRHHITPEDLAAACRARRVHTPCPRCRGLGRAVDGWRGGMQVGMPWDTCSTCWGTGDAEHVGDDVRQLRADLAAADADRGLRWLAHAVGADLPSVRLALPYVTRQIERLRDREPEIDAMWLTLNALAAALREMAPGTQQSLKGTKG